MWSWLGAMAIVLVGGVAQAQNTAPMLTADTALFTFDEDSGNVAISGLAAADADAGEILTVTATLDNADAGELEAGGASGTPSIQFTGSVLTVNAWLGGLVYVPTTDSELDATLTIELADGGEDGVMTASAEIQLDVTPLNDGPTVVGTDTPIAWNEDDPAVSLAQVQAADADAGDEISAELLLTNLAAGSLSEPLGSAYDDMVGLWTFTGTQDELNAALAALEFLPTMNFDSDVAISAAFFDGGEDGATPAVGTVTLTVTPNNDSMTLLPAQDTVAFDEGAADVALPDFVTADPDTGEMLRATISLPVPGGALSLEDGAFFDDVAGAWTVEGMAADVNTALANVTFTADPDWDIPFEATVRVVDAFEEAAIDTPNEATATLTFNVAPANDAPRALEADVTLPFMEDAGPVSFGALAVADPDTDETIVTTLVLDPPNAGAISGADGATYDAEFGIWILDASVADTNAALASIAFEPALNFAGTATVSVSFEDGGENGSAPATGTLTLEGEETPDDVILAPANDLTVYAEGQAVVELPDFAVADDDPDEQIRLTISVPVPQAGALTTPPGSMYDGATGMWSSEGTVDEINARLAALEWLPALDNDVDVPLTLTATDGFEPEATDSSSASAELELQVLTQNDEPTALGLMDETFSYDEDADPFGLTDFSVFDVDTDEQLVVTMTLSDPTAGTLSTSSSATFAAGVWRMQGAAPLVTSVISDVMLNPTTNADQDFTIAVEVVDGGENGSQPLTATWTFNVTAINDPVIAAGDNIDIAENGTATTLADGADSVLANDTDPDGPSVMVDTSMTTEPASGSVTLNADGTFEYVHDGSETDSDSFDYTVCDSAEPNTCSTATVSIHVTAVNDGPTVGDDSLTVEESGTATTLDDGETSLLANDSDIEGDDILLDPVAVQAPANGTVLLRGDGTFEYVHDGSETTSDLFRYRVRDTGMPGKFTVGTVTVTVTPVDDPNDPTCGNGVLEAGEGCDDFNTANGDGCMADCSGPEDGFVCDAGSPSACRVLPRLWLSEYIEGGTRDAVEIFNPGDVAVNLAGCGIEIWQDYEGGPTRFVPLEAGDSAEPGGTFVVCNEQAAGFTSACDLVAPMLTFNGRESVAIACYGTRIDGIGEWGTVPETPFGTEALSMGGHVLRRRCSVSEPNPHPWPFVLLDEWKSGDGNPEEEGLIVFTGLGAHGCTCTTNEFRCADDLKRETCIETPTGSDWALFESCAQNDDNPCRTDTCSPGGCGTIDEPSGTRCDTSSISECAGNACDGMGVCQLGPINFIAGTTCNDNDDSNNTPCAIDRCDGTGVCGNEQEPEGSSCDDGDPSNDSECAVDRCDAGGGCIATFMPEGSPCGDGMGSACTMADGCDGAGACVEPPMPDGSACDDGVYCNGQDSCAAGTCTTHAGDPCADGPDCANVCNELALSCLAPAESPCGESADDDCTAPDTCDGVGTCLANHKPDDVDCDDGDLCNGVGTCDVGVCNETTAAVVCADPGPCQLAGVCQPNTGNCTYEDLANGSFCDAAGTGSERCFAGSCEAVTLGDVCDQPLTIEVDQVESVTVGERNDAFTGEDHCLGEAFDGPDVFLEGALVAGSYRARLTPTGGGNLGLAIVDTCDPLACTESVDRGGAGLTEILEWDQTTGGPVIFVVDSRGDSPAVSFDLVIERVGAVAEPMPEAGGDTGTGPDAGGDSSTGGDTAGSDAGPTEDAGTTPGTSSDDGCATAATAPAAPAWLALLLLFGQLALRRRRQGDAV